MADTSVRRAREVRDRLSLCARLALAGATLCIVVAGCASEPDAAERVERCVDHNSAVADMSGPSHAAVEAGCAELARAGELPEHGDRDVVAVCQAVERLECRPSTGMTQSELVRALAGAEVSGLKPISLSGRIDDLGVLVTAGASSSTGPPDGDHFMRLETHDEQLGSPGFGIEAKQRPCRLRIVLGGRAGDGRRTRALRLADQYAHTLDSACSGRPDDLVEAGRRLAELGVVLRGVHMGGVTRHTQGSDTGKPPMDVWLEMSERAAQDRVAEIAASLGPTSHFARTEARGRLVLEVVAATKDRNQVDEVFDAVLASMST